MGLKAGKGFVEELISAWEWMEINSWELQKFQCVFSVV